MAAAVVLQLLLVPRFQLVGSAVATVTALGVGQLLLALLPASRGAVAASWRAALPVVALGAASQGLVLVLGPPEWLAGAAAAAVYAGGAWGTGLVRSDDLTALARALGGVRRR
jgi:sarcosine oxidase gamma subunit